MVGEEKTSRRNGGEGERIYETVGEGDWSDDDADHHRGS
jgi:hypothetical protein